MAPAKTQKCNLLSVLHQCHHFVQPTEQNISAMDLFPSPDDQVQRNLMSLVKQQELVLTVQIYLFEM
jgi:hypothetical protein